MYVTCLNVQLGLLSASYSKAKSVFSPALSTVYVFAFYYFKLNVLLHVRLKMDQVRGDGGDGRSLVEAARQHRVTALAVRPALGHSAWHLRNYIRPRLAGASSLPAAADADV